MSDQGQKTKENAAATGFIVLLAAAAGWAGVLIAALAVGWERAWNGRGGGAEARAANREGRLAAHRQWLTEDAKRSADWRQKRRAWWAAGADPAAEPKTPPMGRRAGAWARRRWARTRVGLAEFVAGFLEGWRAADKARTAGAGFAQIASTRPEPASPDAQPQSAVTPEDASTIPTASTSTNEPTQTTTPAPTPPPPAVAGDVTTEGEPMTAPTTTGPQVGTQTESNATVMAGHLEQIRQRQARIAALNDELAQEGQALAQETRQAAEFAEQTGQTAQTRQALDASTEVAATLGQHVGGVADAAVEAEDQVGAARDGLRPVEQAEDALVSAGADGRAVAPATAA